MLLAEDDVLLGPVQRPPGADAPLQRAADAGAELRMAAPQISSNMATGRRPGAAFSIGTTSLSQYRCQRIRPSAAARRLLCEGSRGSASIR